MRFLDMAAFVERSRVNGPGVRAVVWAQGCPRKPICPGCYNPDFLETSGGAAPRPGGASPVGERSDSLATSRTFTRVSVEELAERILALQGIDGVTFSGGEPFHQAGALADLAGRLRNRVSGGLSVAIFTGFTLEEIRAARRSDWDDLLSQTDLLIDGPYRRELASPDLPLRSSANQRLILLSDRIPLADLETPPDAVEVTVAADGSASATGLVDGVLLQALRSR